MIRARARTIELLAIAGLVACVAFVRIWTSQLGHIYRVRRHIERITPAWLEFQHTNQGFEQVHLFAYTGGDGTFGAYGAIWSSSDLERLRAFMESTHPPRPVYVGAVRVFDTNAAHGAGVADQLTATNVQYHSQIFAMQACIEWFDSIGYSGVGRKGLERCLAAFKAGDKAGAIKEYRRMIGHADNFASALVDLDTKGFSNEQAQEDFNRVMAVMVSMALIMGGNVK